MSISNCKSSFCSALSEAIHFSLSNLASGGGGGGATTASTLVCAVSVVVPVVVADLEFGDVVVEVEIVFAGPKNDSMEACLGFLTSIPVEIVESAFRLSEDMIVVYIRNW